MLVPPILRCLLTELSHDCTELLAYVQSDSVVQVSHRMKRGIGKTSSYLTKEV